jgi:hypothetical protein
MSNPVTDNTARGRFELVEQGETAFDEIVNGNQAKRVRPLPTVAPNWGGTLKHAKLAHGGI